MILVTTTKRAGNGFTINTFLAPDAAWGFTSAELAGEHVVRASRVVVQSADCHLDAAGNGTGYAVNRLSDPLPTDLTITADKYIW